MAVSHKGKGKYVARKRRHLRLRKKITGTAERPRLSVRRSNRHIFAQIIDDVAGRTLVSASSMEDGMDGDKTARARKVGELVGQRAKDADITSVVFDRGGNKYHGRIAALADGARESGLTL